MITARLTPEFEEQVSKIADSLTLSASDLVRIGLSRVVEEFNQTGRVAIRPATRTAPDTTNPEGAN